MVLEYNFDDYDTAMSAFGQVADFYKQAKPIQMGLWAIDQAILAQSVLITGLEFKVVSSGIADVFYHLEIEVEEVTDRWDNA